MFSTAGLPRAGDQLLQPLRDRVNELCLTAPWTEVSELGDESVAPGAVRTALDHIDQEAFDAGLQL
ncbi:hypothetical protein ACFYZ2_04880 [Streptomyces sviceus]|uniref:hypothetical protein n=1 Tax=Streptomyces sviceus TaxID=285530 RepID=UPI0036C64635